MWNREGVPSAAACLRRSWEAMLDQSRLGPAAYFRSARGVMLP